MPNSTPTEPTTPEEAPDKDIRVSAAIPAELARQLQTLADANDRTLALEIRRALRAWVTPKADRGGLPESIRSDVAAGLEGDTGSIRVGLWCLVAIMVLGSLIAAIFIMTPNAGATTPAATVTIDCTAEPATARVTISNTGWWWGIVSDMVLSASDVPGIPAGTHVPMAHPVSVTLAASPATLHIVATWPEVNDEQHPLTIVVPPADCPTPPDCPDGTRPLDMNPPPAGCVPNEPTTSTSSTPPVDVGTPVSTARPAAPIDTTPAVTG